MDSPAPSRVLPPDPPKPGSKHFGTYLRWLGRKQHARAQLRTPTVVLPGTKALLVRMVQELFPWNVNEYPGRQAMLAHVLGVKRSTAARNMQANAKLRPAHARRALGFIRAKIATLEAIAAELEKIAIDRK